MNESEWLNARDPETMRGILRVHADRRKSRLLMAAFCRRVWRLLTDERSRRAVEVVERCADGLADDGDLKSVHPGARAAFHELWRNKVASLVGPELARAARPPDVEDDPDADISQLIQSATGADAGVVASVPIQDSLELKRAKTAADGDPSALAANAVWIATASETEHENFGYTLGDAALSVADCAASASGDRKAEMAMQCNIIREVIGNPFRPQEDEN